MKQYDVELVGITEMEVALVGIRPPIALPPQGQPPESRERAER
jgi:hypothetical protein